MTPADARTLTLGGTLTDPKSVQQAVTRHRGRYLSVTPTGQETIGRTTAQRMAREWRHDPPSTMRLTAALDAYGVLVLRVERRPA